ncbi:protein kinase-like domain, concanavalin A-like lectin/glucanase domain protein [Tanacetum coccineum]
MGDANPIRTFGDYSRPSHEGYRNTIELPKGNNVAPLQSNTIRLIQNGCSFHGLRSEDPNHHLKDFLKLVNSLNLDVPNRERMCLCLFQFSLRDQASNWLERLLAGSISTWEDHTTRFLAQFFLPGRTAKLRNDILMFQQHQGESLFDAWTCFKDLLQKVPHHGIDLWLQNDPRDLAKPVKAISFPQDVPSTSDRHLIELKNQVQRLMEAHLAPKTKNRPQLELKDPTATKKLRSSENDEEKEVEWIDAEEPLNLIDTSKESVYESLIKEMPRCSLNYDFRIRKGDPRNLKIPCMIGHKFIANTYIDVYLPINIMSLDYYNFIRKDGYEYRGRNFLGLRRDMHVFVGNMSYVMDFAILEYIETNIDPSLSHVVFGRPFVEIACLAINRKHWLMPFTDEIREVTFKTPYKDPKRNDLTSEGHDLLSSRVILNEDDYDR